MSRVSIWLDILTPKQALLLGTLSIRLNKHGFNTIVTTRSYDYTEAVLKNLGISFTSIGGYGEDRYEKLIKEIERMHELLNIVNNRFDLTISYPNPLAARIAFGLGKPYIVLTDSPHSEIPSRLSLPLADYVVFSTCIPRETIEAYVYKNKSKLIQYNGVDEVEWLKDLTPDTYYVRLWELEPYSYAIVRPPEIKASYYRYSDAVELFRNIIKKLLENDLTIVYLPRYREDSVLKSIGHDKRIIIPEFEKGIVGHKLIYYASIVVTGGASLAREAALLGTPGLSLFPEDLYVDKCLQEKMLPLSRCKNIDECLAIITSYLKEPERYKGYALSLLKEFERPSDYVLKIVNEVA
ncbi:MAG: DUF354 domain-containing protein [Ignisphaera sp.]